MSSLFSHSTNINDFLKGFDGVLKYWFNRLHDTKSSFHIINLRLHSFNSFHLSGNFNKRLSIIKSLKNSGCEGLLNVFNCSSFCDSGISITTLLGLLSRMKSRFEINKEFISIHLIVHFSRSRCN